MNQAKITLTVFFLFSIFLTGCSSKGIPASGQVPVSNPLPAASASPVLPTDTAISKASPEPSFTPIISYRQVSAEEAKSLMDNEPDYIILDVRADYEFAEGHIPGAIQIAHTAIAEKAEEVLTDKNQLILVYCRSGNRSKLASATLAELGYTNVVEFGGIINWPYETVK